jgi:hypothetical protein
MAVPGKAPKLTISNITSNSARIRGVDPYNGGSSIDVRELLGQREGTPSPTSKSFDLDYTWNDLLPGTRVSFWWRAHNRFGWGAFSDKVTITLLRTPNAPVAPTLRVIDQTTFRASYPDPFAGGSGIFNRHIGITTSPTALPTVLLPYHGSWFDLYGDGPSLGGPLTPGGTYYVRAQVRNSIGFSPWSAPSTLYLIAGAYVKHNGVWRRAVPYVKVGGVWKLSWPRGRILGIWEETG